MAMAHTHPQLVGNSFVGQYYNVLHQSPQVVHRFYTDASFLSRAEAGPEGHAETVCGQSRIHDKVMSMDYMGLRAEIKTVDCQDSFSGSVLVMVTGSLSNLSNDRRDFVQTFFLAPQSKGYFVLNDMFRYLDEPHSSYAVPNGVQEHSPTPESVSDPVHLEVSETGGIPDEQIDEGYDIPEQDEPEEEVPVEETAQGNLVLEASEEVVDLDESQRDLPKISYASILRVAKDGRVQHVPQAQKLSPAAEMPVAPSPKAAPLASPALPPPMEAVEEAATEPQAEPKAIYIKNLPGVLTVAQLDEEFQRFGAVKAGATNIKRNQTNCYAFLEFEEATSARSAIQASPIQFMGKSVYIEEKRPLAARVPGVGGFRGRGRGRSDGGGRGRGHYGNRVAGRGFEGPSNRGRGGHRGGFSSSTPPPNNNVNNSSSSSGGGAQNEESYHHQHHHHHVNHNNNNNSGYTNGGAGANPRSGGGRRAYYKSGSYGRGAGGHQAASGTPAAVTAA